MCLGSQKYKGFVIYRNENKNFHSEYYSIFNPQTRCHVHISTENAAKSIVDCFRSRYKSRFGRLIRNQSMKLEGFKVMF